MSKLTPHQVDEIVHDYRSGHSIISLSRRFEVSREAIRYHLDRKSVERREPPRTLANLDEIRRRYQAGESITFIAHDLSVSKNTVQRALGGTNLTRPRWKRKYAANHDFFNEINTELNAYWLGFIAADGCVTDKGVVQIALASKDRNHLERLKEALQSTHPIYQYEREEEFQGYRCDSTAILAISSPELTADLIKHGVTPRKTATLDWPEFLAKDLIPHYLRGFFDGDGGWNISASIPSAVMFSIIAPKPWLGGCQAFLAASLGFKPTRLIDPGYKVPVYKLRYGGGRKIRAFHQLIYENATVYLPRKRKRIEEALSKFGHRLPHPPLS